MINLEQVKIIQELRAENEALKKRVEFLSNKLSQVRVALYDTDREHADKSAL